MGRVRLSTGMNPATSSLRACARSRASLASLRANLADWAGGAEIGVGAGASAVTGVDEGAGVGLGDVVGAGTAEVMGAGTDAGIGAGAGVGAYINATTGCGARDGNEDLAVDGPECA